MESKERVGWGFQLKVRATTTQTSLQSRTGEYTRFPRAKNLEVHPLSTPSESSNSRKPAYNKNRRQQFILSAYPRNCKNCLSLMQQPNLTLISSAILLIVGRVSSLFNDFKCCIKHNNPYIITQGEETKMFLNTKSFLVSQSAQHTLRLTVRQLCRFPPFWVHAPCH